MPLYAKLLLLNVIGLIYNIIYLGWFLLNHGQQMELGLWSQIISIAKGEGAYAGRKLTLLSHQQAVIATTSLTISVVVAIYLAILVTGTSKTKLTRQPKPKTSIMASIMPYWLLSAAAITMTISVSLILQDGFITADISSILFVISLLGAFLVISNAVLSTYSLTPMLLFNMFLAALIVSIPWEFMREYEERVAAQATVQMAGYPAECQGKDLSTMTTISLWFKETFTWKGDRRCLEYHTALLSRPLWQVLPSKVFVTVLVKTFVAPLEFIAESIGQCYRSFFMSIPAQYQWFALIQITLLALAMIFCFFYFFGRRLLQHEITGGHLDRAFGRAITNT